MQFIPLPDGYFFDGDIRNYRLMFELLRPGVTVCEVGAYLGRSLCCVADIVQRKSLRVHVVDSFGDLFNGSGPATTLAAFGRNIGMFDLAPHVWVHAGLSHEVAGEVPDGLALLFIDADHSYAAVRRDLELYAPKVAPGGIVAGHDYDQAGVRQAAGEVFDEVTPYDDLLWRGFNFKGGASCR